METFEDKLAILQEDMISIALEYSDDKADKVYLFASHENNSFYFNVFFKIGKSYYKKHQLKEFQVDTSINRQSQLVDIALNDFIKICEAFSDNNREIPTQLKIMYNKKHQKASGKFSYNIHYSNSDTLTADDIFEQWYNEVKEEVESSRKI